MHFAELRNTIAHGAVINDADWTFEGHAHLDRAHDVLLRAIRRTVVNAYGDPALHFEQGLEREVWRWARAQGGD